MTCGGWYCRAKMTGRIQYPLKVVNSSNLFDDVT